MKTGSGTWEEIWGMMPHPVSLDGQSFVLLQLLPSIFDLIFCFSVVPMLDADQPNPDRWPPGDFQVVREHSLSTSNLLDPNIGENTDNRQKMKTNSTLWTKCGSVYYFVVLVRCGVVVCALTTIIVNELNVSVYFIYTAFVSHTMTHTVEAWKALGCCLRQAFTCETC